jgi:hypothetical protein
VGRGVRVRVGVGGWVGVGVGVCLGVGVGVGVCVGGCVLCIRTSYVWITVRHSGRGGLCVHQVS